MTRVVETAIRSIVSKGVTALATFNRGRCALRTVRIRSSPEFTRR